MTEQETEDTGSATPRTLTTARAAGVLGISSATLKRYVDRGLIRAEKTARGHRRIPIAELVRLIREGEFPDADLSGLFRKAELLVTSPQTLYQSLVDAAIVGDSVTVRSILVGAVSGGMPIPTLADTIISPAMTKIGHGWEVKNLDVMEEHRGTQVVLSALYELRTSLRAQTSADRPVAIGGAPENDPYILATLLAELTLLEQGWDAINLGSHTPFSALMHAIDTQNPKLIWISASHLVDAERFLAEYEPFYEYARRQDVAVVVGGRALTPEILDQMRFSTHGNGLTRLADFAAPLKPTPNRPQRGRPRKSST